MIYNKAKNINYFSEYERIGRGGITMIQKITHNNFIKNSPTFGLTIPHSDAAKIKPDGQNIFIAEKGATIVINSDAQPCIFTPNEQSQGRQVSPNYYNPYINNYPTQLYAPQPYYVPYNMTPVQYPTFKGIDIDSYAKKGEGNTYYIEKGGVLVVNGKLEPQEIELVNDGAAKRVRNASAATPAPNQESQVYIKNGPAFKGIDLGKYEKRSDENGNTYYVEKGANLTINNTTHNEGKGNGQLGAAAGGGAVGVGGKEGYDALRDKFGNNVNATGNAAEQASLTTPDEGLDWTDIDFTPPDVIPDAEVSGLLDTLGGLGDMTEASADIIDLLADSDLGDFA